MKLAVVVVAALALAPAGLADTNPLAPAKPGKPLSTQSQVTRVFRDYPKVAGWLKRYPPGATTTATFSQGIWTVNIWSGTIQVATGKVDDTTTGVLEAWTGPQVA